MKSATININSNQLSLWNELPVVPRDTGTSLLFAQTLDDENETTSQTMRLLPITAGKDKNGVQKPCLASITGLKGEALKERANEESIKLKDYFMQVMLEASKTDSIGGQGMKIGKNGRLQITLKRLTPQVQLLSDVELARQIGCSVDKVAELRKSGDKTVELKPTPQNGKPELVPSTTPETKPEAPVANPGNLF